MTYCPKLKILKVILISELLAFSATFTVQLVSFRDEDSSRALTAIMAFLTCVLNILNRRYNENQVGPCRMGPNQRMI